MKMRFYILISVIFFFNCQEEKPIKLNREDFQGSIDKVTEIMVHDIFSPPVASRIFAYPNIAAFEILAANNSEYKSLNGEIKDLPKIDPSQDVDVNIDLAALIAHMDLSRQLIFSEDMMVEYRDSLYKIWNKRNPTQFEASKTYAMHALEQLSPWVGSDNYKQTRTMPQFTLNTDDPSRWQPTPPAYMQGIEPSWAKIRPLAMKTSDQFRPISHPDYSLDDDSSFKKELVEVYDIVNKITEAGDESEEMQIAKFWDCNPYVSVTRGHLMFAKKKITPGAHWMGIAKIACKEADYNFEQTVYANTKTSIAVFDAFISCWDEKYRSNLVRPETLINTYINDQWSPILQTPPFPEYPSGHSVVSGAASTVLTSIFGDDFEFVDDTEVPYGLPIRTFKSFNDAAQEAAMSRFYGGIHYMAACVNGLDQGIKIGHLVADKMKMRSKNEE
ncbi:PAP2 superfamily protein [Flavobacteriaceae bacterium MAR_2010_188]|nr:PAP2 superfamily protein [Flavobacteriaceae bacterium MAR_2010_188]